MHRPICTHTIGPKRNPLPKDIYFEGPSRQKPPKPNLILCNPDLHIANNDSKDEDRRFQYSTLAVGGRYFLRSTAISPWIGGGASLLFATRSGALRQDGSGVGVFGAVGLELLRFNRHRMAIEFRLNLPFSKLSDTEPDDFLSDLLDQGSGRSPRPDRYVTPFSLSISYLRDAPWLSRWW